MFCCSRTGLLHLIGTALIEEANRIADEFRSQLRELEKELADIEARKLQVETKRNQARLAPERSLNYAFKIGTEYQCPRCWVRNETRTALRPVRSDSEDFDLFRCGFCDAEYVIPAR